MDEPTPLLVGEDRPQGPRDGDRGGEVALGRGERVGSGGGFEEKEREEDEYFGPYACAGCECVYAEGFEEGEDDEDCCPPVVEGEGEVDEELVPA